MIDFLLTLDNALTTIDCDEFIAEAHRGGLSSKHLETHLSYRHYDFPLDHPVLQDLNARCISAYRSQFPSLDYMDNSYTLAQWRFKHFPPDYAFDRWHSEHNLALPHRVVCIIVYLSDHSCGTEFMHTGDVISSVSGRAVVFPTFWTHTHRGQLCPQGKDRYIMSNYLYLQPSNSDFVRDNPPRMVKKIVL